MIVTPIIVEGKAFPSYAAEVYRNGRLLIRMVNESRYFAIANALFRLEVMQSYGKFKM